MSQIEDLVGDSLRSAIGTDIDQTHRHEGPRAIYGELEVDDRRAQDFKRGVEWFGFKSQRAGVIFVLVECEVGAGSAKTVRAPDASRYADGFHGLAHPRGICLAQQFKPFDLYAR